MIESFADKETRKIYEGEQSRKLPQDIQERALLKLVQIHTAKTIDDLRLPPSNHLEALRGDLKSFHSIRINNQWRVIFIWIGSDTEKVSIQDYH